MDDSEKYKRYMVFESYHYDATGGLGDCNKSFDEKKYAIRWAKNSQCHSVEVFDRIEGVVIYFKYG